MEGRRRLRIVLSSLSGGLCLILMILVLLIYGTPYDPKWWGVMGGILVAAFIVPMLVVPAVDWVVEGYRRA